MSGLKRQSDASTSEKGKKSRHDSDTPLGNRFQSIENEFEFNTNFGQRVVNPGREIDFHMLESIGFPYLEVFENFKWTKFLSLRGEYYDVLVREFYTSFVLNHDHSFSAYVRGNVYQVDLNSLCKIFEMDAGSDSSDMPSLLEMCRVVYKNPNLSEPSNKLSMLNLHERVLQLIILGNILCRSGGRSCIPKEEIWIMYSIMTNRKPNLFVLILDQMEKIVSTPKRDLHFGYFICQILRTGTPSLFITVPQIIQRKQKGLSFSALRKIGCELKEGKWIYSKKIASDEAEGGPSFPSNAAPQMDHSILNQGIEQNMSDIFEDDRNDVQDRFEVIDDQIPKEPIFTTSVQTSSVPFFSPSAHTFPAPSASFQDNTEVMELLSRVLSNQEKIMRKQDLLEIELDQEVSRNEDFRSEVARNLEIYQSEAERTVSYENWKIVPHVSSLFNLLRSGYDAFIAYIKGQSEATEALNANMKSVEDTSAKVAERVTNMTLTVKEDLNHIMSKADSMNAQVAVVEDDQQKIKELMVDCAKSLIKEIYPTVVNTQFALKNFVIEESSRKKVKRVMKEKHEKAETDRILEDAQMSIDRDERILKEAKERIRLLDEKQKKEKAQKENPEQKKSQKFETESARDRRKQKEAEDDEIKRKKNSFILMMKSKKKKLEDALKVLRNRIKDFPLNQKSIEKEIIDVQAQYIIWLRKEEKRIGSIISDFLPWTKNRVGNETSWFFDPAKPLCTYEMWIRLPENRSRLEILKEDADALRR